MSAVAKIAKPAMRGMHIASIKKNLVMATVVSNYQLSIFKWGWERAPAAPCCSLTIINYQ